MSLVEGRGCGPDLSVIVVNYRSAELTVSALECVKRSAGELTVEAIVVDAGSCDRDLRLLHQGCAGAQIVELGENRGFAVGTNAGIARASGRNLLLLNPDAFAQGNAVAQLVSHLDTHPHSGLVAPLVLNEDRSPQDNAYRRFPNLLTLFVDFCTPLAFLLRGRALDPHHVPRARLTGPRSIAHANGAVMLVRSEAASATGPLDEGFFLYLEETEWQRRMADAGWERELLPAARFIHLGGASTEGFALASPAYMNSVRRYYKRPRLAFAVIALAASISHACLVAAIKLGFRSPRIQGLERGFSELLVTVRRSWRASTPAA